MIRLGLLLAALVGAGTQLLSAQQPAYKTVAYLVRHAEKASDGTSDPHLTDAGVARAKALAALLRDSSVTSILVTQYQRTRETAAPLAAAGGTAVTTFTITANMKPYVDSVVSLIRRANGKVLVVGHSNTVPLLIQALGNGLVVICDSQFADLFIVRRAVNDSMLVERSHYGAADPAGAEKCQ